MENATIIAVFILGLCLGILLACGFFLGVVSELDDASRSALYGAAMKYFAIEHE